MFARLGRACYDHRRAVALLWLVLLVLGVVVGSSVFGRLGSGSGGGESWESVQAYDRLGEVTPYGPRLTAVVDGRPVEDPVVQAAVTAAREELAGTPGVARVVDAYAVPLPDLRAEDGRASLVAVDLARDLPDERREELLGEVERRLRAIGTAAPVEVTVGGTTLVNREVNEQIERDTQLGEIIALPLSLLAMIAIFGGLAAAGVPFLGALASIAGGLLAVLGWSYVLDEMDPSVVSVTTVLGLGLSIDYALLVVSRYREERGAGLDPRTAVERTSATAGRTITYSALVVATSLSALFVFPTPIFRAIAAAGASVVLVALLAGLTLTPALIGLFGRRIKAPTRPVPDTGFFSRLARRVQRRPLLVTLSVAAVLLAAGSPFLHARFQNGGADLLPREFESRRFVDLTEARFPARGTEPLTVLAEAPLPAVEAYATRVADLPGVRDVHPPEQRGPYAVFDVVPSGAAQGDEARGLVDALRAERPEFRTWVTGDAAVLVDFTDEVSSHVPYALGLLALATFVLLFLMTGSVLVPVKALVMNTLSLGASLGALVWVFQDGHLAGLLGITPPGGLETWVPVIAFAFAFGLSMDYEVFLLSRVKELHDAGHDNDAAVALGLQRSGRIITSAALLMLIVFAGFAAGRMLGIKEMGLALALTVLVDATLVRCLLVPATMTLLGEWNWWAPGPLRRLHARVGLREAGSAPTPAAAAAPTASLVGKPR